MDFVFGKTAVFFRADMAGLGKYSTGGYGRIGVYRVNVISHRNLYDAHFNIFNEAVL